MFGIYLKYLAGFQEKTNSSTDFSPPLGSPPGPGSLPGDYKGQGRPSSASVLGPK